jgi:hypothetical protein
MSHWHPTSVVFFLHPINNVYDRDKESGVGNEVTCPSPKAKEVEEECRASHPGPIFLLGHHDPFLL